MHMAAFCRGGAIRNSPSCQQARDTVLQAAWLIETAGLGKAPQMHGEGRTYPLPSHVAAAAAAALFVAGCCQGD